MRDAGHRGENVCPVRGYNYPTRTNQSVTYITQLRKDLLPLEDELPSDFDRLIALRGDPFAAR